MSKKIIAGLGVVAGLAVALAPTATFATKLNHTDTLSLELAATCNIATTDGVTHTPGTAGSATTWTGDTLSGTIANGQAYAGLGSTTFSIICTGAEDWSMQATPNALTSSTNSIPFGAYTAGTTSGYNFTASDEDDEVTANGLITALDSEQAYATVATGAHSSAGANTDTFTVTYAAGVSDSQLPGTYEGTIVYELVPTAHI
ncbi:hypothetical protein IJG21_01300 [Candidatus Saccharibacteria bacterium]|nr:hypothetical protein [Candidatus Saccharibacteria bacterium]